MVEVDLKSCLRCGVKYSTHNGKFCSHRCYMIGKDMLRIEQRQTKKDEERMVKVEPPKEAIQAQKIGLLKLLDSVDTDVVVLYSDARKKVKELSDLVEGLKRELAFQEEQLSAQVSDMMSYRSELLKELD